MAVRRGSINRKKRKKTRKQVQNILNNGREPTFEYTSEEPDDMAWQNLLAYNWYNMQLKSKNHRAWIIAYAKSHDDYSAEQVDALRKVPSAEYMAWDAIYARSLQKGAQFSDEKMAAFLKAMGDYITLGREKISEEPTADDIAKKTKSIQDHINSKVDTYQLDLNPEIDSFLENGKSDFSLYTWLKENNIPGTNAKRLTDRWIQPLLVEIAGVIKKTDEQLVEAYDYLDEKTQRLYAKFLMDMKTDVDAWSKNAAKTRKPRKAKPVSLQKKVAKLNYKKRDDSFKIASVNPENIIDAETVWLFNTNRRELIKFTAKSNLSLDIKGSTLLNVDLSVSYCKRLRKPLDILPLIAGKKKNAIEAAVKKINAKPKAMKAARINKHMVLLAVI